MKCFICIGYPSVTSISLKSFFLSRQKRTRKFCVGENMVIMLLHNCIQSKIEVNELDIDLLIDGLMLLMLNHHIKLRLIYQKLYF